MNRYVMFEQNIADGLVYVAQLFDKTCCDIGLKKLIHFKLSNLNKTRQGVWGTDLLYDDLNRSRFKTLKLHIRKKHKHIHLTPNSPEELLYFRFHSDYKVNSRDGWTDLLCFNSVQFPFKMQQIRIDGATTVPLQTFIFGIFPSLTFIINHSFTSKLHH